MVSFTVTLVSVLFLGAAIAQPPTQPSQNPAEIIDFLISIVEDDDFNNVTTRGTEEVSRPKRSLGFGGGYGNGAFGNNNAFFGNAGNGHAGYGNAGYGIAGYGNGGFGGYNAGCGVIPAQRVQFVRCFTPGRVVVQRNQIVHNYYRQGNYGQCLNYFRALPCNNVATVANGYVGHITAASGRSYSVNACQSCCGGNPGIVVRCNSRPYNRVVRQFVFQPQVNNVNYNNFNQYNVQDGGYGGCATC
ncbi:hypothetical protein SNE40_005559 [Patella caerulea]|uniref:Uncharacterized protein n=1 Tax=Patella caerulea TaxID=87958 RepID=A0AAN8K1Q7_PATCE